jgi:surfeit locus 1 family protein
VNHTQRFGRSQWLIFIVAIACMGITASLGVWQLRRAAYKEQLAEAISNKNTQVAGTNKALNAIDLVALKQNDWLHRRVQLQGRWLHEHTVFLDNRPMQVARSQRVGFYVATPFAIEGGNRVIWVQRGWIARDFQDRSRLPTLPESSDLIIIQGRLVSQISRVYEMKSVAPNPPGTGVSRIWQNLPVIHFDSKVMLPMAMLQTAPDLGNDPLLREWPAADTGVAKHYGYAFQWFALSALILVLYVWFQLISPRSKRTAI